MAINVNGNYYYMVEGSPHVWLKCTVINMQDNNYYTTIWVEGSPHVWLKCTVINVQGNNYYTVEGALTCGSHAW